MAKRPGPTLRAQWLGKRLRELRERNDMTLKQAGEYLQRNLSMVSRFETGEYPIRRGDVLALLDLYDVSDESERDALTRLSEDIWRRDGWERFAGPVDQELIDFPWLESRAERICSYDAMVVPGLLQTPDYAACLIRNTGGPTATEANIATWLEFRLARQRILSGDRPTRLATILDESVLRRRVGGAAVMRQQLVRLLEASHRRNIRLRVVPFAAGEHAGLDGAFTLFEMPVPYPNVAYLENLNGRRYLESTDADHVFHAYDRLRQAALGEKESAALIEAAAEELDDQESDAPGRRARGAGRRRVAGERSQSEQRG
jgi:transcriptional regulator with XRE-family HTH domain